MNDLASALFDSGVVVSARCPSHFLEMRAASALKPSLARPVQAQGAWQEELLKRRKANTFKDLELLLVQLAQSAGQHRKSSIKFWRPGWTVVPPCAA